MDEQKLDLRGLKCPLPALFCRRALARAEPGTVIEVWADDPMAAVDVPHMCHSEGHRCESVVPRDGYSEFALRVRPGSASAAPRLDLNVK